MPDAPSLYNKLDVGGVTNSAFPEVRPQPATRQPLTRGAGWALAGTTGESLYSKFDVPQPPGDERPARRMASTVPQNSSSPLYAKVDAPQPPGGEPLRTTPPPAPATKAPAVTPADHGGRALGPNVSGVAESYEVKLPAGMLPDNELLAEVTPVAREAGLSQSQFDRFVAAYQNAQARQTNQRLDEWVARWEDEVHADGEIGGTNFEPTVQAARSVIDRFGTPELATLLDESGFGSHPELIRLLGRVGRALGGSR